jgi:integrase
MGVFKRGRVFWYKFTINGSEVRESAHTGSKTLAKEAERIRRRELEESINRIPRRQRMPLFRAAAEQWLNSRKPTLSKGAFEAYRAALNHLLEDFGQRLVCDIEPSDIARLQARLTAAGKSARTVNLAVAVLRMILKSFKLWGPISDQVHGLRERKDVGRAISPEDEQNLLEAVSASRSPALLPLFVLSLDTGLRAAEVRALRQKDLLLVWNAEVIEQGEIFVAKSKTESGTGRVVPLTKRARAVLTMWLSRFPVDGEAYVFPRHKIGIAGADRLPIIYAVSSRSPMGFWKKAWHVALQRAGTTCRWHDLRHSFISRLCENSAISEQTIMSLAGHVSKRMLDRYSHIRKTAKEAAIASLENQTLWVQNWVQSTRPTNLTLN